MRTKICTSLGALLLFLAPLGCSDPDAPSPEQPPAEPEFIDVTESTEEHIEKETPGCYYNYFRFQNASDHTVYIGFATIYGWESTVLYIRPGEQATHWVVLERLPGIGLVDVLVTDLSMMGFIQFWVNAPAPNEFPPLGGGKPGQQRWLADDLDTMALYSFYEGLEYDSPRATPKDPARWTFERFSDYRVRWTYRITNEDHDEAVRQTLERWADRDEEVK